MSAVTTLDIQTALDRHAAAIPTTDSERMSGIAATCPHCGTYASFDHVDKCTLHGKLMPEHDKLTGRSVWQLQCPQQGCKRILLVASLLEPAVSRAGQSRQDAWANYRLVHLWPRSERPSRAPAELQGRIRKYYDESRRILSDSPSAAALLARSCMQDLMRNKMGIKGKRNLHQEIEEARKSDALSASTKDCLHHVRNIANGAAHPEGDPAVTLLDVTFDQAEYTVFVLELLFDDLYHVPGRIEMMSRRLSSPKP